MGIEGIEALGTKDEPLPLQIRGRGHSSWKAAKKPYKIKLEQKTSIMGMPKNKHWALLKPSENTVAGLQLGHIMNMAWTPNYEYGVDSEFPTGGGRSKRRLYWSLFSY